MRRILLVFLLFAAVIGSHAQSASLYGVVFEEDGENKISNAIVSVYGTTLVTETDADGMFLFQSDLPLGEQILTISKDGYEERFLPVEIKIGLQTKLSRIDMSLTKKERKRRGRLVKDVKKEERRKNKEREEAIAKAKKAEKKADKRLAKEQKRDARRGGDVVVSYEAMDKPTSYEVPETSGTMNEETYLIDNSEERLRRKYAKMMGVTTGDIRNIELYEFIDEWIGTPYKMGGHTKQGIDCSAFTQKFLSAIFDHVPERTAQTMFNGGRDEQELYSDVSAIRTGDLIFFNDTASEFDDITHVGVYLEHGYFVHSTSNRASDGRNGVQISELNSPIWKNKRVAWRRMKMRK